MASNLDPTRNLAFQHGRTVRRSPVQLRELRHPVVFYRSSRAPGSGVTTNQTFTKIGQGYARKDYAEQKMLSGEDTSNKSTHYFWIRNDPTFTAGISDYVLHGKELYSIVATRIMGERDEWIRIGTRSYERTDGMAFDGGFASLSGTPATPQTRPPNAEDESQWD